MMSFNRIAGDGVSYNHINSSALTYDWHLIQHIDQPMNLTARTQGFSDELWRSLSDILFRGDP